MSKKYLFSPIGNTDPIKYLYDGSMLHICRYYEPDVVYLYLSKEMVENHKKDNRYVETLNLLGDFLNHKFEVHIIENPDMVEVQQYDVFYDEFRKIISEIEEQKEKEDQLLVNMASGTPGMKSALLIMATLAEYRFLPIQVSTPQKKSNLEHEERDEYDVKANWELNEDNEESAENRCQEVKCLNLMRLLKIDMIKKHLLSYDYHAALAVGKEIKDELNPVAWKWLQSADARAVLDWERMNRVLPENNGNANIYQTVNLKKNTKYKLKAKVQLTEVGQTMFVNLKKNAQNLVNGNEVTVKCTEENKGQYQDVELNIDTGNEESIFGNANTANLTVCFMKWTESTSDATYRGKVFVDDVSLTEVRNEDDNYNLVWADEFNETELDKNNWGYELGHIRGLEQQHYTNSKDNVYLEDGNLVIKATNRKTEDQYEVTQGDTTRKVIYDSGSVRTHGKQEFLYGRIEMKAKLPKGQAVFPAFWTLGSDFHLDGNIAQGIGWPDSGEIDIMELIGNGTAGGVNGNRQVYQTLHYGTNGEDDGKYAGHGTCYTLPSGIFNDDYHVFGINWSKGKIEWYVDDQIVRTVDYSDDQRALECIDRPQYIEFNLALGGAWPGAAGENLAGTKYEVDYVRYARNEQQQKDADTFYANAYKINGEKDVTMTEGETPDLLAGITSDKESIVDYSINDEPMFTNVGGNTHVSLLCTGKNDTESLKSLKPGTYNLYYTAYKEGDTVSARTRRQVSLTVEERTFEKDLAKSQLELNGAIGSTLETIKLPAGWEFLNPKDKISEESQEVDVIYPAIGGKVGKAIINGYEKAVIVSGENTKLEYNASKPLEITINVSARNIQKVLVDGKEIDTKYYTIENISRAVNGNSKVVLTNEYLKTLSSGEHKVEIQTTAGNVDTIFTVVKSNSGKDDNENPNPGTGKDDNEKPNPGTGSDDNQKPNTGTENKDSQTNVDNKKNESVEGVSNTNKKTTKNAQTTTQKSTKTGDQTPVELLTMGCLVSLLAIIILKKKKVF